MPERRCRESRTLPLLVVALMACGSPEDRPRPPPPEPRTAEPPATEAPVEPPAAELPASDPPAVAALPPPEPRLSDIAHLVTEWEVPGRPLRVCAEDELDGSVVVPEREAIVWLDYPLSHVARVPVTAPSRRGFTRGAIHRAIAEAYRRVYEEEEATASRPAEEGVGGVINRTETDGAHGIWGHVMSDLFLEGVGVYRADDGTVYIEPGMGS